jgi:cystathionine beta-lyase/cystathionine gamma-synthase
LELSPIRRFLVPLHLKRRLALPEDARYAFAFSSGVAVAGTVFHPFKSGDRILPNDNVYCFKDGI